MCVCVKVVTKFPQKTVLLEYIMLVAIINLISVSYASIIFEHNYCQHNRITNAH